MRIQVLDAFGSGTGALDAYDAALELVGLHDYNLIPLSSVIPPGASIDTSDTRSRLTGGIGDRLYVVEAAETCGPGEAASAGLGWALAENEDGGGVFLEAHGPSEAEVFRTLSEGLDSMIARRPERQWKTSQTRIVSGSPRPGRHGAAVVIATFETASWLS